MPNLNKNLEKDLKKVESLMRKNLSKEPVVSDLYDYIFNKSGKKVRASISLISSYGMNKNQQNRVKLAAIIELLHTATLVHDDIVDNSDLRRGRTTVNVAWSNSHGVLIGDFIYSKAFMLMNEIGNLKVVDELSSAGLIDSTAVDSSIFGTGKLFIIFIFYSNIKKTIIIF